MSARQVLGGLWVRLLWGTTQLFALSPARALFISPLFIYFILFILRHHKYNENSKRKNGKNGFNNGEGTQRKL